MIFSERAAMPNPSAWPPPDAGFSLDPGLLRSIFRYAKPLGHFESADDLNLGFGYLYYALGRMLRPRQVLVIGSGFGFSVVCLALALRDNASGALNFVDPSYSLIGNGPFKTVGGTAQWDDPEKVKRHFARFGVEHIVRHHHQRSDEYFAGYDEPGLAGDRPRVHRRQSRLRRRARRLRLDAAARPQEHLHSAARHEYLHPGDGAPRGRQALAAAAEARAGSLRDRRLSFRVRCGHRARDRQRRVEAVHALAVGALAVAIAAAYLYWRLVWFWRNPLRVVPATGGLVSAADGTVVYVKRFAPDEDVIHVKRGLTARLTDILRDETSQPKLLIGVFMSPFDVHFNRAPLPGTVAFVRHYEGRGRNVHMGAMHWRILTRRPPYYEGSTHIVRNERTVTRIDGTFKGSPLPCYVVQIAAEDGRGHRQLRRRAASRSTAARSSE